MVARPIRVDGSAAQTHIYALRVAVAGVRADIFLQQAEGLGDRLQGYHLASAAHLLRANKQAAQPHCRTIRYGACAAKPVHALC